jgi:hypothetical protein
LANLDEALTLLEDAGDQSEASDEPHCPH